MKESEYNSDVTETEKLYDIIDDENNNCLLYTSDAADDIL
jgi:hypothetical protein